MGEAATVRQLSFTLISRESLSSLRAAGVDTLLAMHWREIAHYDDIPLDVDWAKYEAHERADTLRLFTIRVNGVLIGYVNFFLAFHLHYATSFQAHQDVLYLDPRWRGGSLAKRLLDHAHLALYAEGVQLVTQHIKAKHAMAARLLKSMDYELMDHIYVKRLDRDEELPGKLDALDPPDRVALTRVEE